MRTKSLNFMLSCGAGGRISACFACSFVAQPLPTSAWAPLVRCETTIQVVSLTHVASRCAVSANCRISASTMLYKSRASILWLVQAFFLNSQKIKQIKAANKWNNSLSWVFTDDFGNLLHPNTPAQWFTKFIKYYNEVIMKNNTIPKEDKHKYLLKVITFHGLRHTSASLLISKGQDVVTIAHRLGHSNSAITSKIYAHAFEKLDLEAAESLDEININRKNAVNAKM